MTTILNESLHNHSDRVKGSVVLITGAASGIGRATALQFAKYGANVVIGDLNVEGAEEVVDLIRKEGGSAAFLRTDVRDWDNQVSLFELAFNQFGSVDVVVANAGVAEVGSFETVKLSNGLPIKPNTKTLEVNLIGTVYTAHLATHYLPKNKASHLLKSIVLIGSVASWQAIPSAGMYTASKHGVLGLARSIHPYLVRNGIRLSIVHPWFAHTDMIRIAVRIALAGLPVTSIERIASTVLYSATDPDPASDGSAWLLLDDGPVLKLEPELLTEGVYKIMNARAKRADKVITWFKFLADMWNLVGKQLVWISLPIFAVTWYYRSS